jgi:hypothetical protein
MFSARTKWIKIPLFNLLIIAVLGVTMRYKIAYSLPFIEQKKILHAHSHFAFAGWVTQILMFLLIQQLQHSSFNNILKKYQPILYANLIAAYGMLFSFPIEGYGLISIIFSTLSIFTFYCFGIVFWKDLNRQPQKKLSHAWFKAAIVFNALSSAGPFTLAYLMAQKIMMQKLYLLSVYFFLHFQYNGWLFFACMGLFTLMIEQFIPDKKLLHRIFYFFLIAVVPAYFLSALWVRIPLVVYLLIAAAALLQLVACFYLFTIIRQHKKIILSKLTLLGKQLLGLSFVALSIKLLLQAFSIIPSLSKIAFGFRSILIGYLHLVLLGVITIFILGFIVNEQISSVSKKLKIGIYIFTGGIILNETALMIQGVTDIFYIYVPFLSQALLGITIIMLAGIAIINLSFSRNTIIR